MRLSKNMIPGSVGNPEGFFEDVEIVGVHKDLFESLYSHQDEAFESIKQGEDTLLVSKTASGKTLSFFLPVFDEYIKASAPFSALLLYPTRALSRDQESTFNGLMKAAGKNHKIGTFDGETPAEER